MRNLYAHIIILTLFLVNGGVLKADVVTVKDRQILVNGSVYIIKGICYNPVPKGSTSRSWTTLTDDLALMKEADINTIRVYAPIDNKDVLDEIDAAGIKIIMGFGYYNEGYYDILSGTYLDYITKYKDHDAILFWEFGNEYNYHPEWFDNDINNWYSALNEAAEEAYYEDENHPTATAHGEIPNSTTLIRCSNVQIWGMNVYRWDNPSEIFTEWSNLSTLPMYLAEAGADSFMKEAMNGYEQGENEQAQADATKNILNSIFNNQDICSGVTLFEFSDEWWKADNPNSHDEGGWAPNSSGVPYDGAPNEEYWGIVDIDRNKKLAFDEVKTKYESIIVSEKSRPLKNKLKVYPSPVLNRLYVSGVADDLLEMKIVNIQGMEILTIRDKKKYEASIDIQNFENGVYFLQCIYKNKMDVVRFVKM